MNRRKNIFTWNHISDKLDENDISELKAYYRSYHRKNWAYKQALKKFKKMKLIGNSFSIIFASGGIASAAASGGIALIAVSGVSLLIQCWMNHQNLDLKIQNCIYAYQSYNHILIHIKEILRSGNFDKDDLLAQMTNVDSYVTDNSPPIDKILGKWSKKFMD